MWHGYREQGEKSRKSRVKGLLGGRKGAVSDPYKSGAMLAGETMYHIGR